MKTATRVLAMIAMGGGMAGAAVAVAQVPSPQPATTVAVSAPGATEAVQQLADESAQLHVAIASAQTQLAQLRTDAVAPSASPDLATLLAQAQSQLSIARQRVAVDEALIAKLQAVGHAQHPSAAAPKPLYPSHPSWQPAPSEAPATPTATQQPAESTPAATTPTRQPTQSPSPRPTNRHGDD